MRSINFELILRETPELAWINEKIYPELVAMANLELYNPREIVFQGDQQCPNLMLVVSGALHSMFITGQHDKLDHIFYENHVFGLGELFGVMPTNERMLVAESTLLLLTLPMDKVRQCLARSIHTKETFESLNRSYEAYHFIRNSTFLGDLLSPVFLVKFVSFFQQKEYQPKQFLFKQDDDPDGFYLCSSGKLKVQVTKNKQVVFSAFLQAGDYFGELALTNDAKRSASIYALSEACCYYLSREDFNTLVQHEPRLLEGFELLAKLAYGN
jgi:signal-transduction protein with cAMP-binding, CBS, and nucleotidyltransferase domain